MPQKTNKVDIKQNRSANLLHSGHLCNCKSLVLSPNLPTSQKKSKKIGGGKNNEKNS